MNQLADAARPALAAMDAVVFRPMPAANGRSAPLRSGGALHFDAGERLSLLGLYGFIALLHAIGIGTLLYYRDSHPALLGLGFAAYMFGLRHAFDADHIAAVDDTVRYMLQNGRNPLGVGFFFSLGHSTIVLALALALAFAAATVASELPQMREIGGIIGMSVSGLFLWLIGLLNLRVLLDMLQVWKQARSGTHDHAHLEGLLAQRGFLNRLFGGRLTKFIRHSRQMYPLGLLFGLGFDTASEIGLLAMTAGAASGNLPVPATLALPVLFAAGMSLMDTTDGVLMTKAYDWAFVNPLRKIFYGLATTTLSVVVALAIGSVELLQVAIERFGWRGPLLDRIATLDFGVLGYIVVAMFLLAWALSVAIWKFGRLEQRIGTPALHAHEHVHADHTRHRHEHFH
ncbi:HoxN/HupN/NixA family nickel/cobalt transporter [Rhodanobacter sp. PCA2]|uniref:HoxN/HupN/NixA family nickel/cobalt transporter n=1 Tax=Rhodanobacter sp. PCA2 TaxID=2006117 RepID=UPI001C62F1EE|nr:HoxN/HupN/NixA family nickel/cobalt transporter [Rhodanobacter sp. PCA2]